MSEISEKLSESKILRIAFEKPWLLLILDKVLDLSGEKFTARDIAETLGLKSYIVQRALWWLRKYGFVEEHRDTIPRRYSVKTIDDPLIEKLKTNRWICGNTTVYRLNSIYVVLINRGYEIIARLINRDIVDSLKELNERDPEKLKEITGHDIATIKTALRVIDTVMCKRREDQQSKSI